MPQFQLLIYESLVDFVSILQQNQSTARLFPAILFEPPLIFLSILSGVPHFPSDCWQLDLTLA